MGGGDDWDIVEYGPWERRGGERLFGSKNGGREEDGIEKTDQWSTRSTTSIGEVEQGRMDHGRSESRNGA